MNIQEAIKSGKRFRRKGEKDWYYNDPECFMSGIQKELSSDDWEVEEKTVTITAEQLETAFTAALKSDALTGSFYNILKELKKELGL